MYWVNTMVRNLSCIELGNPFVVTSKRLDGGTCTGMSWLMVLSERTNIKSQGLVPAYFALIIIIVVHVVKHQSVLKNTCRRQESLRMMQGSPSIIIAS